MCLGVPGKVVSLSHTPLGMTMGRVSFGGITKEVCMAYVPDAAVGDYVVVHVGFAIAKIDPEEAERAWRVLAGLGETAELTADGGGTEAP